MQAYGVRELVEKQQQYNFDVLPYSADSTNHTFPLNAFK